MSDLNQELERLKKLCDEATRGPWFNPSESVIVSADRDGLPKESPCYIAESIDDPFAFDRYSEKRQATADFIAESRTAMPRLIEALEFVLDGLECTCFEWTKVCPNCETKEGVKQILTGAKE